MDPAEVVHTKFLDRLKRRDLPVRASNLSPSDVGLKDTQVVELFHSQVLSRQLDRASRRLQSRGESNYTVASSGHECNAAFAEVLRLDDMAFLHYRDAAFQIHRAKKAPGQTPLWDILLSFVASSEDPIASGRHKVLGSKPLFIPPQTSTIASHLPKAVGAAHGVGLSATLGLLHRVLKDDAVILCSFGDASANHSTAQGAINTACWTAYQREPMPIVLVCEDNGIGISTPTPPGWIEASFSSRSNLKYLRFDGTDLVETFAAASEAVAYVRETRSPVFLHMKCVRLYGHAGSDVQAAYLTKQEIEDTNAGDPLLHAASLLIDHDIMNESQILDFYNEVEEDITRAAEEAMKRPKLASSEEVMQSLIPPKRAELARSVKMTTERRAEVFGSDMSAMDKPQHTARLLSWALTDLMMAHPEIVLAGEDIGPKGGVYNVTAKLHARFGSNRVINTLLDEQSILGLGIGLAHNGVLPICEIQFLAYVHNAEDQIRGEAATLSFFSNGQYTNPMIVRIPGLPYQKGFGGHFHNDNSLAVFRDIPGVIIACPSNGRDAVAMLRECVRLAREEQRVVVFVEPIALYMTRDLHAEGDGLWTSAYEPPALATPVTMGALGRYGEGADLAIVTYGNGCYLSRQAQKILSEQHDIEVRVIDLRWLAPLNISALVEAVKPCTRVLVVDECRITGSLSEALMAMFVENAPSLAISRIAAEDSFIAIGRAATLTLPSRDSIVTAALGAVGRKPAR